MTRGDCSPNKQWKYPDGQVDTTFDVDLLLQTGVIIIPHHQGCLDKCFNNNTLSMNPVIVV